MYLIFDTETTGLPRNKTAPLTDHENWPRLVQIAWQLHDNKGKLLSQHNYIVKPEGFDIPYKAEQVHGVSTKRALEEGHDLIKVLGLFIQDLARTSLVVGHNIEFDINIIGAEFVRKELAPEQLTTLAKLDTGIASTDFCQLTGGIGGRLKMPRLVELHQKLFGKDFGDAHDAAYDVAATARCYFGLLKQNVVKPIDSYTARRDRIRRAEAGCRKLCQTGETQTRRILVYRRRRCFRRSVRQAVRSPPRTLPVFSTTGNTRCEVYCGKSKVAQHARRCADRPGQHVWRL